MWALCSCNVLTASDADASVAIVRLQWLSTRYKTTPETQGNTVVSERDQDKTTRTVSSYKTTVSARWSPMYQYLALTSLRNSHRLPTRHTRELGTDRRLFFCFRTSVFVSAFSTCPRESQAKDLFDHLEILHRRRNPGEGAPGARAPPPPPPPPPPLGKHLPLVPHLTHCTRK